MSTKVHKVRFHNTEPLSINSVCYNRTKNIVAVARQEASIEIWDVNHSPFLLTFIPGVINGSVEAMAWAGNRLFSTGLGGSLVEYDCDNLSVKKSVLLTGYAAWCLDVNPANTCVAVGTEQGYINVYSIENDDVIYNCLFDKQEGRIMCCKYNKTGTILVTGSVNTIRIWNALTGQAINKISATRRGKEVIVWCLEVLSDNTIISGDSNGLLTFWDSTTADQIEAFATHKSDILALTVSDDEKTLYCSGVDPTIVLFNRVEMNNKSQSNFNWVRSVQRHIHEHDVRALTLRGETLLSVGVDGYLTFSSYPPKWVMRMPPMLPSPRSSISKKKKLLLLRYNSHLEVWKMGSYSTNNNGRLVFEETNGKVNQSDNKNRNNLEQDVIVANGDIKTIRGQPLKIGNNPIKLVSIQTKGQKQLKCCELSPDGQIIIYSTESNIRMLKLETDEDDDRNVSLTKIMIEAPSVSTFEKAAFTEDSENVIISSGENIYVLTVDPHTGAAIQQHIQTSKYLKSNSILHINVSQLSQSNCTYMVVAGTTGAVSVWLRSTKSKFEHYISLPKYTCVPSAIMIDHRSEIIVMTYVDQKIVEYDLVNKKYNDWPNTRLPKSWFSRKSSVHKIHMHPLKPNVIIFQDYISLWILEKKINETDITEPSPKKRTGSKDHFRFRVIPVKYLSDFHWLHEDEAVMLEMLPEHIVSQLPPVATPKT